jgi:hypothetical protein
MGHREKGQRRVETVGLKSIQPLGEGLCFSDAAELGKLYAPVLWAHGKI